MAWSQTRAKPLSELMITQFSDTEMQHLGRRVNPRIAGTVMTTYIPPYVKVCYVSNDFESIIMVQIDSARMV